MIKIKTTNNTLTDIGEVYVKTSPTTLAKISAIYVKTTANALERIYSSAPPPLVAPTITNVYSEGSVVYIEYTPNSNGDVVELRFDEYAWNGAHTCSSSWTPAEEYAQGGFNAYGCTETICVHARSVRDSEYSDETSHEYYLGLSDHTPWYTSNNDGKHYIHCDVCGEDLGEGYCMDHDYNGDGHCDHCGHELV